MIPDTAGLPLPRSLLESALTCVFYTPPTKRKGIRYCLSYIYPGFKAGFKRLVNAANVGPLTRGLLHWLNDQTAVELLGLVGWGEFK
jgi:hypothetical protein